MNIKKKCQQINSLLGDLSSTGIKPIPDVVFEIRLLLHKIEAAEQSVQADGLRRPRKTKSRRNTPAAKA